MKLVGYSYYFLFFNKNGFIVSIKINESPSVMENNFEGIVRYYDTEQDCKLSNSLK